MSEHGQRKSPLAGRDRSIDALRGLAVVFVALGHALLSAHAAFEAGPGLIPGGAVIWIPTGIANNLLLSMVYSFHMPLFAFVAGLVLKPHAYSLGNHLRRRATGLLVPYVAWFVVLTPLALVLPPVWRGGIGQAIVYALKGTGVLWWVLWYLYALFLCTMVVVVLARTPWPRTLLALSALGAIAVSGGRFFPIPWDVVYLPSVLWIYPALVLGYLMRGFRPAGRVRWALVVGCLAAFAVLLYLRHPLYLPAEQPLQWVLGALGGRGAPAWLVGAVSTGVEYAGAVAAIVGLYSLYVGRSGRLIDAQAWAGRRSLGIYAIHFPLQWVLVALGVHSITAVLVLSLAGAFVLTRLLERWAPTRVLLLGMPREPRAT